jgi:hypothetical protein
MKSFTLLLVFAAALLMSCASGSVGPRLGGEVPVAGVSVSGNVQNSSANFGAQVGVTAIGELSEHIFFQSELLIRSVGARADISAVRTIDSSLVEVTSRYEVSATLMELPFMIYYTSEIVDDLAPFAGGGLSLGYRTGGTESAATLVEILSGPSAGGRIESPYSRDLGSSGFIMNIHLMAGIDYQINETYGVRFDSRLIFAIVKDELSSINLLPAGSTPVSVTAHSPQAMFALGLTFFFRL